MRFASALERIFRSIFNKDIGYFFDNFAVVSGENIDFETKDNKEIHFYHGIIKNRFLQYAEALRNPYHSQCYIQILNAIFKFLFKIFHIGIKTSTTCKMVFNFK